MYNIIVLSERRTHFNITSFIDYNRFLSTPSIRDIYSRNRRFSPRNYYAIFYISRVHSLALCVFLFCRNTNWLITSMLRCLLWTALLLLMLLFFSVLCCSCLAFRFSLCIVAIRWCHENFNAFLIDQNGYIQPTSPVTCIKSTISVWKFDTHTHTQAETVWLWIIAVGMNERRKWRKINLSKFLSHFDLEMSMGMDLKRNQQWKIVKIFLLWI